MTLVMNEVLGLEVHDLLDNVAAADNGRERRLGYRKLVIAMSVAQAADHARLALAGK